MTANRLTLGSMILLGGLLAGCATPPAPDLTAEAPYCHKSNKGRTTTCTATPAPSLNADAQAKQFAPDPTALTVYVVRRNWGDGRKLVTVLADGTAAAETLPNTMVRYKLKPGTHTIALEFEGQRPAVTVEGKAGEVRFVRLDGMVWAWKSTFTWATDGQEEIRERALKARLVADSMVR